MEQVGLGDSRRRRTSRTLHRRSFILLSPQVYAQHLHPRENEQCRHRAYAHRWLKQVMSTPTALPAVHESDVPLK